VVAVWFDVPADMGDDGASPVVQWTCPGSSQFRFWSMWIGSPFVGWPVLEVADENGIVTQVLQWEVDFRGRGPSAVAVKWSVNVPGVSSRILMRGDGENSQKLSPFHATPVQPISQLGTNSDLFAGAEVTFTGTISHLIVAPDMFVDYDFTDNHQQGANGFVGERAADRIARLCGEESIPVEITGNPAETEPLGPQQPDTLLNLLTEAAEADGGTLGEQRDEIGLAYHARAADYNATPVLTLDYHDQVAHPLHPTDDDQHVRNDVTVDRRDGSSARTVLDSGPMSVQAPPDGVGIYDEGVTLNVAADTQLNDQAGWRLHLGTVDEARWPLVKLKLHKHPDLIAAATTIAERSVIEITGLPAWLPPDDVRLIVDGYTEVIEPLRWSLEFNTVPASPFRVGVLDDPVLGRLDTDGSTLAAPVDADDTSLSVATASGPLWTTSVPEFPFDVRLGGEVVTVTNITGASSPQTFTVTRSVNGVTKSHAAGADVRLAQPLILSF
jgi:hypothetical protein